LKLREAGLTYRSIADILGKQPEQIKKLLLLAERLSERRGE
jgi:DNA-binding CsgD family transcriptional regulator